MRTRRALLAAFALGALAALAVVAATTWTGFVRPVATSLTSRPSPLTGSPSPEATPTPPAKPAVRSGLVPVERAGPVLVYDPENHGVIMFGGSTYAPTPDGSNTVSLGDTWLWNGASWSQLNVPGPSPRSASVAAYDSVRHVIVLFGGSGPGGVPPALLFDDTWTWDGTAWTQQFPAHKPSPSFDAAMAFDERRG